MIKLLPSGVEGSTRDRLLEAGLQLFAERGFRDTTVGDIESAAGLQPRRGALYHYFSTKQALLEAVIQAYLARIESGMQQLEQLPGLDLRSEVLIAGRWFLAELDSGHYLNRIMEQDGDRLPGIRQLVLERIIDAGHRRAENLIRRHVQQMRPDLDTEALAAIAIGPLANHRRVAWTYGRPPLDIDDARLLNTWSEMLAVVLEGLPAPAGQPTSTGGGGT